MLEQKLTPKLFNKACENRRLYEGSLLCRVMNKFIGGAEFTSEYTVPNNIKNISKFHKAELRGNFFTRMLKDKICFSE